MRGPIERTRLTLAEQDDLESALKGKGYPTNADASDAAAKSRAHGLHDTHDGF